MSETTGFWSKVRGYLKFRHVNTRGEKVAVWILIPLVILVILMFWGIPPLDIIPIWGPSMQPTMQVWNLPEPREKWSFSGWVHYDPDKKPEMGSIVYFRIPNTRVYEVKRVTKVNDEGELWVEPDNTGVSGEGSDNSDLYQWLCPKSVIGVVDGIGTPTRAIRWFTSEGRFHNTNELHIGNLYDAAKVNGIRYMTKHHGAGWYGFRDDNVIDSGEGFISLLGDVIVLSIAGARSDPEDPEVIKICRPTVNGLEHLRTYYADAGETWRREDYLFFGHDSRWWVIYPNGIAKDTGVPRQQGDILEDMFPGESWRSLIHESG